MSRLVTPLMAETTTTTEPSDAAVLTIAAAREMQEASPTEVPPNFITQRGAITNAPARELPQNSSDRSEELRGRAVWHSSCWLILGTRFENRAARYPTSRLR